MLLCDYLHTDLLFCPFLYILHKLVNMSVVKLFGAIYIGLKVNLQRVNLDWELICDSIVSFGVTDIVDILYVVYLHYLHACAFCRNYSTRVILNYLNQYL